MARGAGECNKPPTLLLHARRRERERQKKLETNGRHGEHGAHGGRGAFITLEGDDGVGKTTQMGLLSRWYASRGFEVVCLHEPGGTELGEQIRALLLATDGEEEMDARAELLLFEAARAQLVSERIRPALASGAIVLCDRFADSTVAYQGYGRELGPALVERLNEVATGGLAPDLTLLLSLDAAGKDAARARVVERAGARGVDRMESAGDAFRARVHRGFAELAAAQHGRVRVIDAAGAPEEVHAAIVGELHAWEAGRE